MKFPRASLAILLLVITITSRCWGAPLTLPDCLQKARDNNPALRTSAWDSRMAEQTVRQATSAWYPRLDVQGGYTSQQAAQAVQIVGRTEKMQDANFAFAGIAANYMLYDFGRREARLQQARAQAGATASLFEASRTDVSLQVIEGYFGILESEHLVTAARDEITQVEQHRRIAQALFDEGVVTRNDILQADVRLAAARQSLLARQNLLDNTWLRLNYLTGAPAAFRGELIDGTVIDDKGAAPDEQKALAGRPELQALRLGVEASQAELRHSKAEYLPELFTKLALDYLENSKYSEQYILSATIGLRINLFDGFATSAARDRAVQKQSRARDLLRQNEEQVRLEINVAENDLRVAGERIRVAETAIRQSEENLRINRERYRERVGTATEVLDAQTLLTQTRTDYYRALYDRQVSAARLKRALGEL